MNIIVIFIIVAVLLHLFNSKKENLTNNDDIAYRIKDFLTLETTYKEYLDFLVENKNLSYNILNQESFYELKLLLKQNKLTYEVIMEYMHDV